MFPAGRGTEICDFEGEEKIEHGFSYLILCFIFLMEEMLNHRVGTENYVSSFSQLIF